MGNLKDIINKSLETSLSYSEYKELVNELFAEDKATSMNEVEDILNYTKLNISRMKRLDKTTKLNVSTIDKIKSIDKKIEWVVLTEGWCGDAAQNLPVINKIAELNDNIDLKLVLRDQNKELMAQFLTNGGEAIPKLIQIENGEVTGSWGPRPTGATKLVSDYKAEHGKLTPEFKKELQVWYNKDKGVDTVNDMLKFLGL
jgi:hypothetical protein